ncbi:MAG: hypothetical protein Q8O92_05720 [Candidatus Latescibacter sp.]|nr:hypothetical protein [Candidatus Latescibacter sp.]
MMKKINTQRYKQKKFIIYLLALAFPLTVLSQNASNSAPASTPQAPPPGSAAQNPQTAAPSVEPAPMTDIPLSELPPPPPMKNVITTEKPVRSIPSGVLPRTAQEAPAQQQAPQSPPADQGKSPSATGTSAQTQTAAAGSPGAPALPGVPAGAVVPSIPVPGGAAPSVAAGTTRPAAGADSSALAIVPPQKKQPQPAQAPKPEPARKKGSETYREEKSIFNVPTANLRTMKVIIDDQYNLVGMVYGEERGFIRVLSTDNQGNFTETWKSPPLNSPVRGIFVENLDRVGEVEIIAYTADGNIFIYGYDTHDLKYRTPEGTYPGIKCMAIANLDNTPELEMLFITSVGKMVQFDPKTKFEQWRSSDTYLATDMIIGNVDNDKEVEIILNTGEVLNKQFKTVKWKSDVKFGERLYLIDMDSDGILELVTEYEEQYIRIFDIDQRREKW